MSVFDWLFRGKSLSRIARKAGYTKDQIGIQSRFVRERDNWTPHLEQTKNYILETAQNVEQKHSVAVLGSGWLLDVPLTELSEQFDEVYLFDIVHPEQIVVKTKKFPNVHLVEADLTYGAVAIAEQKTSFEDFLTAFLNVTPALDLNQYDFVVSVNILNQLDIILCDYLKEKFRVSEQQLLPIRETVQQRHVDALPRGKTCLVTDYREENISAKDSVMSTKELLHCQLPVHTFEREWQWIFDRSQMYRKGHDTTMKVRAMFL